MAVVDLPTPPLPEATAITCLAGFKGGFREASGFERGGGSDVLAALRAVNMAVADRTPDKLLTTSSAFRRNSSD